MSCVSLLFTNSIIFKGNKTGGGVFVVIDLNYNVFNFCLLQLFANNNHSIRTKRKDVVVSMFTIVFSL